MVDVFVSFFQSDVTSFFNQFTASLPSAVYFFIPFVSVVVFPSSASSSMFDSRAAWVYAVNMVLIIAEDRKIIKRLIEKALDVRVKKATGMRMMQGIYLPEEPISLYGCESTKLYLGFSVRLSIKEKEAEAGNI